LTCACIAEHGRLDVLDVLPWAREHGCPWDERTCGGALLGGGMEIVRWAQEHGSCNTILHKHPAAVPHLEMLRQGLTLAHVSASHVHSLFAGGYIVWSHTVSVTKTAQVGMRSRRV
jgi:hypothetical protein